MAVTHRIGHDKRGTTVFRQTPSGDDVVVLREEEVVEIDPATGKDVVKKAHVKDRLIDDELPEVAVAFPAWVEKQK